MWKRFDAFVASAETLPWGVGTILLLLGSVIAVRNLLEILVARNPVFEGLAAFVHYPLAYVAPFLALTLVLAAWSRVAPLRVARLMSLAWLLTLLPPLADLVLHAGAEKPTIGYLQSDPADLGRVWAHFFDPRAVLAGTTAGIRVETLAAVLLGALYVWMRSRRVTRALGAAATIYVVSLFFFSLPALVTLVFRQFDPAMTTDRMFRGEGVLLRLQAPDQPDAIALLWLVPLVLVLGWAWHRLSPRGVADPGERRVDGVAPLLAVVVLLGALTGLRLHLPVGVPLVFAPYDFLALAGAPLAMWLLARAALDLGPGRRALAPWLAAPGLVLCLALGRAPSVGLVAAAAPLVPFGLGLVPAPWDRPARALAMALAAFAAFAGGYGLVIGPEVLARIPLMSAGLVVAAGLGLGVIARTDLERRPWLASIVFALALAVGAVLCGEPKLIVLTLPAGLVAGVVAWGIGAWRPRLAMIAAALALGLALLGLTQGLLATDFVRAAWSKEATCVARLEVVRGEAFERQGNWPLAQGAYRKALSCEPGNVDAMRRLGLGLLQFEKKVPQATELLERAAKAAPDSPTELTNLAALYLQVNRAADALPLIERALARDPGHLNALFNEAQALEDIGRKDEAAAAWRRYVERAAPYPDEADSVHTAREHIRALGR